MSKKNKNKKKKWLKFRHRVVRFIAFLILAPYSRIKYRIKVKRFKEQKKGPYLILMNHQTPFDQFFVGMAFKGRVYYLASDDLFSNGFISRAVSYLIAPIPIKKQTTDARAVMNCIRVCKEGGTIAIAPEGNRTYSGKTEYMNPAIAPLARKLGVPIALFRIEGGYGAHPRWSDVIRKGKMLAYVSRVVEPEEYASLTDDELFDIIKKELYVDEAVADVEFRHKKNAEFLERAIYVCPFCGLSTFRSEGDIITCQACQRQIRHLPSKELEGVGFDFQFKFVSPWYDYQMDFMNSFNPLEHTSEPIYTETNGFYEVIPLKNKVLIAEDAKISLFGDRVEVAYGNENKIFPFDDASALTVLGRNKLNIYTADKIYQFKGEKRFNALKYVHMYHRYRNVKKGEENVKFLGL